MGKIVQRRDQQPLGEVAARSEDDHRTRVGRFCLATRGGHDGAGHPGGGRCILGHARTLPDEAAAGIGHPPHITEHRCVILIRFRTV
jgi:hypothetical protein